MAVKSTKKYPVYGEESRVVLKYQKLLQKTGSTIKATGIFTIGMVSAIKSFQKKFKLPVTGKLDVKTVAALEGYKPDRKAKKA